MRKGKFYRHLSYAVQAGLMVGALGLFMPAAWATPEATQLPTGGLSPTAAITASGANMTVDGKAANNVIAWDSFSIGANAAVNFTGSHNYLNYVTGRSLSEIYGTMSGGGNVYLFNPNGIIFGENANINVGSLYASTKKLDMEDLQAFAQGKDMLLAGEDNEITIHSLSGQQVARTVQRNFEQVWNGLSKGVYIVNGKKWIK